MGLFYQFPGNSMSYTTLRGEQVTINMQGLYWFDTISSAAQMQGNDLITLVVGLPLLAVSTMLAFRGSLRGRLLLTGTLGFFLYTYMSMSMLAAYNSLFLVYVALFGLSLYAFILCMLSFDLADLPGHFSDNLPRGWMAGFMFVNGCFSCPGLVGTHHPTPVYQFHTGAGKYDHPGHPGHGPGTDCSAGCPFRHLAIETQRLGIPAGIGFHYENHHHGTGSQRHGHQYDFKGCP